MLVLREVQQVKVNVTEFMKGSWMMMIFESLLGSLIVLPGCDLQVINWHAQVFFHDLSVYFHLYHSICY
jgi:hypothetical protein